MSSEHLGPVLAGFPRGTTASTLPGSPKVRGGQVLYLDYDGVLHHERVYRHPKKGIHIAAGPEFKLFQHAELLSELLRPYPAVRIVLSTSWVAALGLRRAASYLPDELRCRVIGGTFHSRMSRSDFAALTRGQQVYADYVRRAPAQVLAIDDIKEGWPQFFREYLVVTDAVHGISHPQVLEGLTRTLANVYGRVI